MFPLNKYALALKQNGGIFVSEFRFSESFFCVTQDGEAVEKEKNRSLVWPMWPNPLSKYTYNY